MVEKLRSVLKIPKLRSGAKAIAIALSLSFLPLWATAIIAVFFYFFPVAFSINFLGSFISLSLVVGSFFSSGFVLPSGISAIFAGILFYILLGVKNVLFIHRSPAFFTIFPIIVFCSLLGFFSGAVSLPIVALAVFFLSRDALSAFTPGTPLLSGRGALLSAVLALLVAELSWSVFYLDASIVWSAIAVFMGFAGSLYAIIKYLKGELFKSNAPYIATALGIVSFTLLILLAF